MFHFNFQLLRFTDRRQNLSHVNILRRILKKKNEKTLGKCHLYFAVIQICKIKSLWQLYLILLCRYYQPFFFFFLLFSLACQCNGHSTCINNNVCEQCKNLTTGKQCQDCMPGYYGDPTNGGQCTGNYFFFHFNVVLLQER